MERVENHQFEVAIIGGGFAGLCFAIGLQQHQIPYHIYEASPRFSEIGAGIAFGPNGVNAMGKLHPEIEEAFLKHATPNGYGSARDIFFDCRDGSSSETPIIYSVEGHPYRSIHRATFLAILARLLLPGSIHFNKRLDNVQEIGDRILLSFADGTNASATALVGCDGVRSSVRKYIVHQPRISPAEPCYGNVYSYRGLLPMEQVVPEIGETLAMTAQNYFGRGAHVITYPIEHGKLLNIVGCKFDQRKEWPHKRWQVNASREAMMQDLGCFGSTVNKLLSQLETYDRWAVFDLSTPLPQFYKGRIAIIGDAAHCSTPHTGSGASLAIEDAYVLSDLMHEVREAEQIEGAFRAFDAVRRPRTEKVIIASRDIVHLYQLRDCNIEDVPSTLRNSFDWIWDIDLEEHCLKVKELFRSEHRS